MSDHENLEAYCFKVTLKPGSRERVREWTRTTAERGSEAEALLRSEGIFLQTVYLDITENGDYLLMFIRTKDVDTALKIARESTDALNLVFREFVRETWERVDVLEKIYDIDLTEEG